MGAFRESGASSSAVVSRARGRKPARLRCNMSIRPFFDGVRAMALVAAGIGVYGVVFGSLAQQAGLSLVQAVGMSLIVYSGAAQLVILPLLQSGSVVGEIALAVGAM